MYRYVISLFIVLGTSLLPLSRGLASPSIIQKELKRNGLDSPIRLFAIDRDGNGSLEALRLSKNGLTHAYLDSDSDGNFDLIREEGKGYAIEWSMPTDKGYFKMAIDVRQPNGSTRLLFYKTGKLNRYQLWHISAKPYLVHYEDVIDDGFSAVVNQKAFPAVETHVPKDNCTTNQKTSSIDGFFADQVMASANQSFTSDQAVLQLIDKSCAQHADVIAASLSRVFAKDSPGQYFACLQKYPVTSRAELTLLAGLDKIKRGAPTGYLQCTDNMHPSNRASFNEKIDKIRLNSKILDSSAYNPTSVDDTFFHEFLHSDGFEDPLVTQATTCCGGANNLEGKKKACEALTSMGQHAFVPHPDFTNIDGVNKWIALIGDNPKRLHGLQEHFWPLHKTYLSCMEKKDSNCNSISGQIFDYIAKECPKDSYSHGEEVCNSVAETYRRSLPGQVVIVDSSIPRKAEEQLRESPVQSLSTVENQMVYIPTDSKASTAEILNRYDDYRRNQSSPSLTRQLLAFASGISKKVPAIFPEAKAETKPIQDTKFDIPPMKLASVSSIGKSGPRLSLVNPQSGATKIQVQSYITVDPSSGAAVLHSDESLDPDIAINSERQIAEKIRPTRSVNVGNQAAEPVATSGATSLSTAARNTRTRAPAGVSSQAFTQNNRTVMRATKFPRADDAIDFLYQNPKVRNQDWYLREIDRLKIKIKFGNEVKGKDGTNGTWDFNSRRWL